MTNDIKYHIGHRLISPVRTNGMWASSFSTLVPRTEQCVDMDMPSGIYHSRKTDQTNHRTRNSRPEMRFESPFNATPPWVSFLLPTSPLNNSSPLNTRIFESCPSPSRLLTLLSSQLGSVFSRLTSTNEQAPGGNFPQAQRDFPSLG